MIFSLLELILKATQGQSNSPFIFCVMSIVYTHQQPNDTCFYKQSNLYKLNLDLPRGCCDFNYLLAISKGCGYVILICLNR